MGGDAVGDAGDATAGDEIAAAMMGEREGDARKGPQDELNWNQGGRREGSGFELNSYLQSYSYAAGCWPCWTWTDGKTHETDRRKNGGQIDCCRH